MATEHTDCGEQHLFPGVKPVSLGDRLQRLMDMPLMPRYRQRSCNIGLFDEVARAQLDLFIHTKKGA